LSNRIFTKQGIFAALQLAIEEPCQVASFSAWPGPESGIAENAPAPYTLGERVFFLQEQEVQTYSDEYEGKDLYLLRGSDNGD
jgi:hypothetical protein